MNKEKRLHAEETVKLLMEKVVSYDHEISSLSEQLDTVQFSVEQYAELVQKRREWIELRNQAEAAICFIKSTLALAE